MASKPFGEFKGQTFKTTSKRMLDKITGERERNLNIRCMKTNRNSRLVVLAD